MKIVFDIGGTNTRVACSRNGTVLDKAVYFATEQNYATGIQRLITVFKELAGGDEIEAVVGGVPGLLNEEKTALEHAWHLLDWSKKNLAQDIKDACGVSRVLLDNDTALAALGEAKQGAGANYASVMYASIGTGFGGAWVIDGKLVSGKYNAEPGHQIIDFTHNAKLENLVSGSRLDELFQKPIPEVPVAQIWNAFEYPLSVGLYNMYLHWPSDIIILGGGVTLNSDFPLDVLRTKLSDLLKAYQEVPEIKISILGDQAALVGALSL